jgi:hypothetical protein
VATEGVGKLGGFQGFNSREIDLDPEKEVAHGI